MKKVQRKHLKRIEKEKVSKKQIEHKNKQSSYSVGYVLAKYGLSIKKVQRKKENVTKM